MTDSTSSNVDLAPVLRRLARPYNAQTRALMEDAAAEIERLRAERDEFARCLDGGVDCAAEKLKLRAELDEALERIGQLQLVGNRIAAERDRLRAAGHAVLDHFMPTFPDSRAVDDCLVQLAAVLA
jgi:hypothetical protein